jgi:WD40 repeat protein
VITVASGQPRFTVRPPGSGEVYVVTFNPAGDRLVTITDRGAVDVWNAFDGRHVRRLRRAGGMFYTATVTFSPDGARVLAAFGRNVREWQVADGRQLRTQRNANDVYAAVYGPGGPIAVADTVADTVRIGDLERSKPQRVLRTGEGGALTLAYSRYGEYLAAGTESGAAVIWNTRSGRRVAVLDGGSSSATQVRFTGDGRHLLVANDDGTVRLWDWRPQTSSIVATGFRGGWSVAMSSDRRLLTGTSRHGTTLLLRCPGCAPLSALTSLARDGARPFTKGERRQYLHEGQPQQQDPY